MILFLCRYLRYFWMKFLGYQGRFLLIDARNRIPYRWDTTGGKFTRYIPREFMIDGKYSWETYWWYSAEELKNNFHNSSMAFTDRKNDMGK
jgi:hypothetical protein